MMFIGNELTVFDFVRKVKETLRTTGLTYNKADNFPQTVRNSVLSITNPLI